MTCKVSRDEHREPLVKTEQTQSESRTIEKESNLHSSGKHWTKLPHARHAADKSRKKFLKSGEISQAPTTGT
jgi:hypothetical protein